MSVALLRTPAMPSSVDAIIAGMPQFVWRADQMASCPAAVVSTGFQALDDELPNGGWPHSALIELLLQQHGIGEMQLLRPALAKIARQRRIALIQPPHAPQIDAWLEWDLPHEHLLWIKPDKTSDALWSAEQMLRNGSCGAVLLWQEHCRSNALRRLHLAAQESDTVFWLMRHMSHSQDASPAPLRLGLRPANGGVEVSFVKRRGPYTEMPLTLSLNSIPSTSVDFPAKNHAFLDRRAPASASAGSIAPVLE